MLGLLALLAHSPLPASDDFDPRPSCIDWVAVGRLKTLRQIDYEPGRTDTTAATYPMATYHVRMTIERGIWGTNDARSVEFDYRNVAGAAPRPTWGPWVVFRGRDDQGELRLIGMESPERDGRGLYIPITKPFHDPGIMEADWRQVGWEAYLRPVDYAYGRPDFPFDERDAQPPFTTASNGRLIVHKGFYLKDLPRMFAAVRPDSCGRF